MKIREVINKNPDGFSIELTPDGNLRLLTEETDRQKGFIVGITNNKLFLSDDIELEFIKLCIGARLLLTSGKRVFIGGWTDPETKTFYLDLSLYTMFFSDALDMARLFNQKSIFGLEDWDIINTDFNEVV